MTSSQPVGALGAAGPLVVKIGGSTLGAHDTTLRDLVTLQRGGVVPVVVHGGGAIISQWLEVHAIPSTFVRGLRATDAAGLDVVTAVLAGLVNKQLVADIIALGGRSVGMSGVDGSLVQGTAADPALGYVGTVTGVDLSALRAVMAGGFIPVVATVGIDLRAAAPPRLLNFNADTVAGEVARALGAARLVFLTDVPGVMDGAKQVLDHLGPASARELIRSGAAGGGMIPKIEACLQARSAGTECWITDGRKPNALLEALGSAPSGTRIS